MSLASASIRNPVFAWMLMLAMIVFGLISFQRLGVSQYPDVNFPVVSVRTTLEGAAPEVMESDVADVIEDAVMAVEGVREVSSQCRQGGATISIEFNLSRDIDVALQEVQARVSQAGRLLPKDLDPPVISKTNPEDQPIVWLAFTGTRSPTELAEYAKNYLRDQFLTLPGVGDVSMGGYLQRNVRIWIKADALRARDLGIDDVIKALQRQHVELPAGRIEGPNRIAAVKIEGEAMTMDDWRNLQIAQINGAPVYLKDVALVQDGFEDRVRIARADGFPAQGLGIIKQRGANAVDVARAVKQRVAEINKILPAGMQLDIRVDGTKYISEAISEIEFSLLLAVALTAFVCWVFLGSLSSTINVVIAIPVSILGTFAVMYFSGFTLNAFSLLALSLSIGIVVDDAIMVLENIYRHAEEGEDRVTASRRGAEQITFAAMAATFAIVAIFLPVAFMSGIIGKFFFQFGVVLSVAVLISLIEALTLAPARCSQFLSVGVRSNFIERGMGAAFKWLSATYRRILAVALRWRIAVLVIAFGLFGFSLKFAGILQYEFVPPQDQGYFMLRATTPVGSSIDYTDNIMRQVETILKQTPGVKSYLAVCGAGDVNSAMCFVTLKDRKERDKTQQQIMADLRPKANIFPGTRVIFQDPSQSGFTTSRGFPVEFTVRGPDWTKLASAATEMMNDMKASGFMTDIDTDYNAGMPEVRVEPDRTRALALDIDVETIASAIDSLIGGQRFARYKNNGRRYDVRIRLLQDERLRPEDIGKLYVRSKKGTLIPLSEVCNITIGSSLQSITRKQRERAISIFANPAPGHSQEEALQKVEQLAKNLPEGYRIVFSGGSQVFKESINSLIFAIILGLIVAYMVLGSQFNSFLHPLTVLMALPFSVTGAFIALWLGGRTINIFSLIGIILLLGIVKKNSILLVDYTNQMRLGGMNTRDALMHACPVRLRPILMTTVAMIAGSIPGAISLGPGAEMRTPMSLAVIGGLIVSTLLTLLVVPCFYSVMDQAHTAVKQWVRKRRTTAAENAVIPENAHTPAPATQDTTDA
ncbi:MAG: efflux RND transporter permease subunit [bacterium]|nr:efflux RND transporter permease subunit [Candidatus Sumerlaeota bacterium]